MSTSASQVGKLFESARKARELTLGEVAYAFKVSKQAVRQWEEGASLPRGSKLDRVCLFLGISAKQLLKAMHADTLAQLQRRAPKLLAAG